MVGNINLGSIQAPYWEQSITLPPHGYQKIQYVTDNFQLISASLPNALKVSFGGAMIDTPFRAGMGYRLTEPVQFIELRNDNETPLTVDFALGIGQIQDNRLNVSGQVDALSSNRPYAIVRASSLIGAQSLTFSDGANVAILCTSGTITLNISTDNISVTNLTLTAGQSWELPLATGGTLNITGTGSFNYCIAGY